MVGRLAEEPEMHRLHSEYYAHEFLVARRTERGSTWSLSVPYITV